MSELRFLEWVRRHVGKRRGRILVDTGDDCAVLAIGGEAVLFKVDTVVEGVHFTRGTPWRLAGRKAMGRPLSDIAAMGGIPTFAVCACVLRRSMRMSDARAITRGLETFGVPVVGGDLKSHDGPCVISVTVLGEMRGPRPVLRKGARPGDALIVTGTLGGAIRGHHLRFVPRLREGRAFATTHRVRAMIDVSDGLARDLSHLGVGAELDEASIPRRGSVEEALYDGEDYEILAAADPKTAGRIEAEGLGVRIGTVTRRTGLRLRRRDGTVARIPIRGYEHRFGRGY